MSFISLNTAISITGLSRRTLWRRIADGSLRQEGGGREMPPGAATRVALDDVLALSPLKLAAEDRALIEDADAGGPEAQCDLALLLLGQDQAAEAVAWLRKAAQNLYPEAMHWLGRCHVAGTGVAADEAVGIDWIAQAARRGHATAAHMLRFLEDPARPALDATALEAVLDGIEREVVLQTLTEQAQGAGRPLP